MATTDTTRYDETKRAPRKRQARAHIAALGKRLAAEDRETLDLLEAYDRGDPEAARLLASPSK
jgi:hypothetical protein